jgi:hypothetical protein
MQLDAWVAHTDQEFIYCEKSSRELNACQGMCQEIQVYKCFLFRAENLDDEMVSDSIHELLAMCPGEGFELRSDCAE